MFFPSSMSLKSSIIKALAKVKYPFFFFLMCMLLVASEGFKHTNRMTLRSFYLENIKYNLLHMKGKKCNSFCFANKM